MGPAAFGDVYSHEHHPGPDPATAAVLSSLTAGGSTHRIPVESLLPADSPRLDGERIDHVQALADASVELPPILVHRPSMRVVDGMHRLRAAQLRGDKTVEVRFFDGGEDLVFAAAVQANISHGLPLSQADRQAAALRILGRHSEWSDRTIAAVTGLAPGTVGAIRLRQPDSAVRSPVRLGRDGRVRALSTAEGRRVASEVIARRPEASLREVARAAGISTGTVRDVRRRLARGEDPVPAPRGRNGGSQRGAGRLRVAGRQPDERERLRDRTVILRNLRSDPSLRFTDSGRELLRWLDMRSIGPEGWDRALDSLPAHSRYLVAELADWCSQRWRQLAETLRAQAGGADDG
jgi:hypothetical protein